MRIRWTCAVVVALALAGCSAPQSNETCLDWPLFDTPADAARDALVVRGEVAGRAGTVDLWGVEANRWQVEVDEVLAGGGVDAGTVIEVVSAPQTCRGDGAAYPEGDPLDVEGEVVVILEDAATGLRTITPHDGVVAPGPDGGLPEAWPTDHRRP